MKQHTCMNNSVDIIWKFNSCAQFVSTVVTFFVVLVIDDHETTISASISVKCLRCVFTAPTFAVELKTKISISSLGNFSGAVRDLSTLVDNFQGTLGSLSSDVFERRTSTGSEVFPLLTCLDDIKFVFLSLFTVIQAIWLKICAKPPSKNEKRPLPVDVRRSKTLLLKLPNNYYHMNILNKSP